MWRWREGQEGGGGNEQRREQVSHNSETPDNSLAVAAELAAEIHSELSIQLSSIAVSSVSPLAHHVWPTRPTPTDSVRFIVSRLLILFEERPSASSTSTPTNDHSPTA